MKSEKYILVVEDDFDLLWLMKKFLNINGYEVLTAVTAEKAIYEFSKNIFDIDLVILDITLPDADGKYVCKELLKVNPDLSIIVTTGSEDRVLRKELEDLGVVTLLIKPFDIMNLVEWVQKATINS